MEGAISRQGEAGSYRLLSNIEARYRKTDQSVVVESIVDVEVKKADKKRGFRFGLLRFTRFLRLLRLLLECFLEWKAPLPHV